MWHLKDSNTYMEILYHSNTCTCIISIDDFLLYDELTSCGSWKT